MFAPKPSQRPSVPVAPVAPKPVAPRPKSPRSSKTTATPVKRKDMLVSVSPR